MEEKFQFDFPEGEGEILTKILRKDSFSVDKGWPVRKIIYITEKSQIEVGRMELYYKRCRIFISEMENNPLLDFMSKYEAKVK